MVWKFQNFSRAILPSSISNSDTTINVGATYAGKFPTLGVGEEFLATLMDGVATEEIIKCTAHSGDGVLTVVRGQESTTALAWGSGTELRLSPTAAQFEGSFNLSSKSDVDVTGIADKNMLYWDSGTSKWKHAAQMFWNAASNFLGLRTSSPAATLHIGAGHMLMENDLVEIQAKDNGGTARTLFKLDSGNELWVNGHGAISYRIAGTQKMLLNSTSLSLVGAFSATTTVTGGTGIIATTGDITASGGNVSASGNVSGTNVDASNDVTAGNDVVATGDLRGVHVAASGIVDGSLGLVASGGDITADLGDIVATVGDVTTLAGDVISSANLVGKNLDLDPATDKEFAIEIKNNTKIISFSFTSTTSTAWQDVFTLDNLGDFQHATLQIIGTSNFGSTYTTSSIWSIWHWVRGGATAVVTHRVNHDDVAGGQAYRFVASGNTCKLQCISDGSLASVLSASIIISGRFNAITIS